MAIFGMVRAGLTFLNLDDGTPAVKSAMRAGAVWQDGLAAIGAGAPLRFTQGIMSTALVFDALRSPSLRYGHRLTPIFLRASRGRNIGGLAMI
jgi:hypothetical protein